MDFSEYLQDIAINVKVSRATVEGLIRGLLAVTSDCPSAVRLYWSFGCTCIRQSWYMKIMFLQMRSTSLQMRSTWRAYKGFPSPCNLKQLESQRGTPPWILILICVTSIHGTGLLLHTAQSQSRIKPLVS